MAVIELSHIMPAIWSGLSQLIVLGVAGVVANLIYRRFRERSTARQQLLKEIDDFGVELFRPRKIYQVMIDHAEVLLPGLCSQEERDARRLGTIHQALQELLGATGRFRTLQVEIIALHGFNLDLLAHYLAIWNYLRELRRRMEKGESPYLPKEQRGAGDAFYRLFDAFRYRVSVAPFRPPVAVVQPPPDVLAQMRQAGDKVFADHFGAPPPTAPV